MKNIIIKETNKLDFNDIMYVEEQAFGNIKEAELTAGLIEDKTSEPLLSLLAFDGEKAVGHILFTRVSVNNRETQPLLHLLAPLAVIPEYQKRGIGGMLILEGLKQLKESGTQLVFVLGHMEYYPKYGFIPDAKKLGFSAPYPIVEKHKDAWMVQSVNGNIEDIEKGKVICADALDKPEYWRE